jgi:hypothetical protein
MTQKTLPEKILYLEKLLKIVLLFEKKYKKVVVNVLEKTIETKFIYHNGYKDFFFTQEFSLPDLDERIEHYKNTIKYSFSIREKNKNKILVAD